jgi:NUMOD4 motif
MDWQPIETHVGRYEVSTTGDVRHTSGRVLKQWHNDQGYALVRLSSPRTVARVHRLVAQAFIPNPLGLPFVNHIDFDRAHNIPTNLEWCTQWHNLNHSQKAGRMQRNFWKGKRSPSAKLTDGAAKAVRDAYAFGGKSWETIGQEFGVSKRTIGRIISGESYA